MRVLLLSAASLTALATAPVQAQDAAQPPATNAAPASDETGLTDIVVTARKTSERLIDAPVAVSAIGQDQLKEQGLNTIDDFARQVTGLSFSQAFGRTSDRPVIRGQSNVLANVQFGVETGAAYFIDGIYYQGDIQSFDPEAIERIEVIKGPQSALYGRNTYAGAINYITRDPTRTWTTSGRASAAEFGEYQITGTVAGPIIPDLLGIRVGGRYFEYGGQYTNQLTRKKVGWESSRSGYVLLDFTPGDVRVRLRGQYQKDRDGPLAIFLQGADANNCEPGFRSLRFRQRNLPPPAPGPIFQPSLFGLSNNDNQYFCGTVQPRPDGVRLNTDPVQTVGFGVRDGTAFDGIENEQWLGSSIVDWDIADSGVVLSSLTAYRENRRFFGTDSDHSEAFFFLFPPIPPASVEPAFANTTRNFTWDLSQEVRISTPVDRRVRALLGVYYYFQKFYQTDITFGSGLAGQPLGTDGSQVATVENKSFFGLLEAKVTDTLSITAEFRYLRERKTIIDRVAATSIFCAGEAANLRTFGAANCFGGGLWDGWDPRITVDWKPTPDLLVYGVFATGRKPGGFNGTGGVAATALLGRDLTLYDQETVKGGELGVKAQLFDRRVQVTAAAFYNDLAAVQLTQSIPPTVPTQATTSVVSNTGDATTKGFELDITAAPVRGLTARVGVAYVDARFTSGCDADLFVLNSGGLRPNFNTAASPDAALPLCSIKGKRLPLGSEWIVNGSLAYQADITPKLQGIGVLTYSWESDKAIQTDNFARVGETFLINLRLGIQTERWSLFGFGRNLTDEDSVPLATRWFDYRYGNGARDLPASRLGSFNGAPAAIETAPPRAFFGALRRGRTLGVEAIWRY